VVAVNDRDERRAWAADRGRVVNVEIILSDDQVREIAEQAAAIVTEQAVTAMTTSPWLNTDQAADYIAAKPGRVHDLVALGKLTPRRDGRRLLFRADELDAYIEADS
jgi:excisionase family DNA binding protein